MRSQSMNLDMEYDNEPATPWLSFEVVTALALRVGDVRRALEDKRRLAVTSFGGALEGDSPETVRARRISMSGFELDGTNALPSWDCMSVHDTANKRSGYRPTTITKPGLLALETLSFAFLCGDAELGLLLGDDRRDHCRVTVVNFATWLMGMMSCDTGIRSCDCTPTTRRTTEKGSQPCTSFL